MRRIAIDLRPLQVGHENRGIGNYLINILRYFPTENVEYVFVRYSESEPLKDYKILLLKAPHTEVVVTHKKFGQSPRAFFEFIISILDPVMLKVTLKNPAVFFQADYLLGLPRVFWIKKTIVAHDLIPILFKNMYTPSWRRFIGRKQYRLRTRIKLSVRALFYTRKYRMGLKTLQRANKIVSVSNSTRKDVLRVAKIKDSRIKTIYPAPSFADLITSSDIVDVEKELKKIQKNYLLYIGGTDYRRQTEELIFAHNLLNSRGIKFHTVLVGEEFVKDSKKLSPITKKAIELSSYKDRIHLLGKVNEREKRLSFENAFAFVYPTIYEGFGLPQIEAMSCGTPIITYRNPATEEISRDAALYTQSNDGYGIYETVLELMHNEDKRSAIISKGFDRVSIFDWEKAGPETVNYVLK